LAIVDGTAFALGLMAQTNGYPDYGVRCAYRLRYDPDYRINLIGFRVVLSPFFSEL
jgi:formylglycine-generating enzyme required for sulfatase activity